MLKKYDTILDYNASERSSVSEVAFVEDGTGFKIRGVNVEVEHPQKGDVVYLDASRNIKFMLHDTYDATSFPADCDVIGVVGEIINDNAIVIAKDASSLTAKFADVYQWIVTSEEAGSGTLSLKHNGSAAVEYALTWTGVTSTTEGKQTLAQEIQLCLTTNNNANWSCYYDAELEAVIMQLDTYNDALFETPSCTGITFTQSMNEVPATTAGTKMRNGSSSANPSWNQFKTVEWAGANGSMVADLEPTGAFPSSAIMSSDAFNTSSNMKAKYHTYEEYCAAVLPLYPRWDKGVFTYKFVGEEHTRLYGSIKYHKRTDSVTPSFAKTGDKYPAISRCLSYQPSVKSGHTVPASCAAGKWHLGDPLEMLFIMKDMNTTVANVVTANYDVVNRNLALVGGALVLTANTWLALRNNNVSAWSFGSNGMIYEGYLFGSYRAIPLLTVKL